MLLDCGDCKHTSNGEDTNGHTGSTHLSKENTVKLWTYSKYQLLFVFRWKLDIQHYLQKGMLMLFSTLVYKENMSLFMLFKNKPGLLIQKVLGVVVIKSIFLDAPHRAQGRLWIDFWVLNNAFNSINLCCHFKSKEVGVCSSQVAVASSRSNMLQ